PRSGRNSRGRLAARNEACAPQRPARAPGRITCPSRPKCLHLQRPSGVSCDPWLDLPVAPVNRLDLRHPCPFYWMLLPGSRDEGITGRFVAASEQATCQKASQPPKKRRIKPF